MAVADVAGQAVQEASSRSRSHRPVNDFSTRVATVNGSGRQTANLALLRWMFQMGVPVWGMSDRSGGMNKIASARRHFQVS